MGLSRIAAAAVVAVVVPAAPAMECAPIEQAVHETILDEEGFASFLQTRASATVGDALLVDQRRQLAQLAVNETALWHQLTGAVQVDSVKDQIQQAQQAATMVPLLSELAELRRQFPQAEQVKAHLSSRWAQVADAVNLEMASLALEQAKPGHSDRLVLQQQYDTLRSRSPRLSVQETRAAAVEAWAQLRAKGVRLPSLSTLEQQAQAVGAARGGAQGSASSLLDMARSALRRYWR